MNINWCKCMLQSRCRLNLINLDNEHFDNLLGVYVIWYGNDLKNVVSIGQGVIRDKLIEMRTNKKVQEYGPDLFVTWAAVPKACLEGVKAFLCTELKPFDPHIIKGVDLISVNLP
jgi:hypothetical protein